jgi:2-(1,2-epoxy-1,2-dihydrophenyl)acetyl-CoA isomerase
MIPPVTEEPLIVQTSGRVLRLTLNRPRNGNAIDMALAQALTRALTEVDGEVSVIVLGAEGKAFCAGGDVGEFARADDARAFINELAGEVHRAILSIQQCGVPVVVAVHGNVGGAGIGLVAACDVAIARPTVRLRPAYIALGLTPDAGLTWRLADQLGTSRALDLLMTDGELSADEALAAGLISRVVDDLEAEVDRVVQVLANGPTQAYARLKQLVHGAAQRTFAAQLDLEATGISDSAGSPDGQEGIAAFTARRKPSFGATAS